MKSATQTPTLERTKIPTQKKSRKKGTNYLPNTSKNLRGGFLPVDDLLWLLKTKKKATDNLPK
jgi:hypothetical protein